ncbi:MAG: tetratricopeptide repeat protein [Spirochaetes bacterium]|nr:tetratricopeptide repeat protein [Spirochaetota bacterium]
MKNRNILLIREAFRAYKNKRYEEAAALLEKIITITHDPYPYFLLCVSYLLSSRFSESERIIRKLKKTDPDYLPLLQLESFLYLKAASEIHSVIAAYIDRIDQFPGNKYFRHALSSLRKVKDFAVFQKQARLNSFVCVPKPGRIDIQADSSASYHSYKKITKIKGNRAFRPVRFLLIFSVIILICVSAAYYYFNYYSKGKKPAPVTNSPLDSINIDVSRYDLIDKIKTEKPPVFYYSSEEVLKDFNKAKTLIKNKEYNNAIILINKLENSNANFKVKERINFLRKFISGIEYRTYTQIPVHKILKTPYLYRGVNVEWNGKISNLKEKNNKLAFDLLVDYKDEDIFSGIVDVYSDKNLLKQKIINGDMVSIKGIYINTIGENKLYLVADSIRKTN